MIYPYKNLDKFTFPNLLDRSIELYADKDCLAKVGQTAIKYQDLNKKIQETIKLLQENGISKGDKVALLSENMPNWVIAYFAITYFGAVAVPILADFHASDVHHILKHSEAKAVFVSDRHLSTIEENNDLDTKFVINLESLKIINELSNPSYITQIKQKMSILPKLTIPNENDLCAIIYTSGTTGHSKGVMLSHKNLITNALSAYKNVSVKKSDVFLSILPLAHTLEFTVGLMVPLLHGSSIYYIDKVPTPSVLIKAFYIVKPTMMLAVPLIIEKIYKNKVLFKINASFITKNLYKISFFRKKINKIAGKKLLETFGGRLRFFGIGGAGISPYVEKFLIEADFPYIIGYGLTETAPLLSGSILGKPNKYKSCGIAMPGVELQIKNKNPQTGEGEIIAKSPSIMINYYKDEKQTSEVMQDGWFLTGDLGYIDDDGYLFISGRSKNVIIGSAGENIYPEQIEATINQNEAVVDSLVMQKDAKLVARIHLDYELIDNILGTHKYSDTQIREEILTYLEDMRIDVNSKISSFSRMIKFIEQIEPFVKTPTKKIKRYLYTN